MADRFTEFVVEYDLIDMTALDDSTPTSSYNKSFADISLLKEEYSSDRFLTLEHNINFLDGSLEELDTSDVDIAYVSSEMSDSSGYFTNNPTIQIAFSTYHSSFALSFNFLPVYPLSMRVTWKSDSNILHSEVYSIDSEYYVVRTDVELYNYIQIEFIRTLPYQYIKLKDIVYGTTIKWNQNNVKSATLVQELNPISDKVSINTLSFDIIDVDDEMNFGNSAGMHNYFQRNQILRPYELVGDAEISLGKYFLDTFSNETNVGKMSAVSYMGILDSIQYNDGTVYNGTLAGEIIEDIFEVAEIEDYEIDTVTYNQPMYGTIKPMTCRNALKEILFACNSVIDTTDPEHITISKAVGVIAGKIGRSVKFSTKATKQDYYSGVEVKYDTLSLNNEVKEISKGTYSPGNYSILFSSPYTGYTISGGTISSSSTYWINFTVASEGEVIISGKGYDTSTQSVVKERDFLAPGQYRGTKSFTTTLCNAQYASLLADKLFDYYTKNEMKIDVKYLAENSVINIRRIIENNSNQYKDYIGRYTKRTLDLTGGFIDTAELVGYFDTSADYYYTGTELYAGDNFLL